MVALFHKGIDELQAIPIDFETYHRLGVASHALAAAMEDPNHAFWLEALNSHDVDGVALPESQSTAVEPVRRVDMGICGTSLWDDIVTDPHLNAIHTELAGGPCNISATYYIEKQGPATGGGLHNGGFPKDKNIYYAVDQRTESFACSSTKSVVILSDMSQLEGGPFAAIPGSHKSNYRCPFDMSDATKNPMAVPVFASPGDVRSPRPSAPHTTVRRCCLLSSLCCWSGDSLLGGDDAQRLPRALRRHPPPLHLLLLCAAQTVPAILPCDSALSLLPCRQTCRRSAPTTCPGSACPSTRTTCSRGCRRRGRCSHSPGTSNAAAQKRFIHNT